MQTKDGRDLPLEQFSLANKHKPRICLASAQMCKLLKNTDFSVAA